MAGPASERSRFHSGPPPPTSATGRAGDRRARKRPHSDRAIAATRREDTVGQQHPQHEPGHEEGDRGGEAPRQAKHLRAEYARAGDDGEEAGRTLVIGQVRDELGAMAPRTQQRQRDERRIGQRVEAEQGQRQPPQPHLVGADRHDAGGHHQCEVRGRKVA
jgi:hypothetical protein